MLGMGLFQDCLPVKEVSFSYAMRGQIHVLYLIETSSVLEMEMQINDILLFLMCNENPVTIAL